MVNPEALVTAVGRENFLWLAKTFDRETRMGDLPDSILGRLCGVDLRLRDYANDPNSLTAITLITFAYQMAGRSQEPRYGPKDMLLVKALAQLEQRRRRSGAPPSGPSGSMPLYLLVTGEVGERIRRTKTMNSSV